MTPGSWVLLALPLLAIPAALACVDLFGGLRALHSFPPISHASAVEDFEVLVPIYGSIRYLENVAYLSDYGARVMLCTTTTETPEFDQSLEVLAAEHGFRVFRADVPASGGQAGKRATSGTIRDRIVRDAHRVVAAPWIVCLDADTTTRRPLGDLVGIMAARNLDLASVQLIPAHSGSLLGRLQTHEYRLAMLLRRVLPWLVSGACHAARSSVHRQVMLRHSLFFQGNDVELGMLADALGFRVGHVPFEVPTTVPEQFKPWFRQRLAWAGGEVRLFLANPQLVLRHPFFWCYGACLSLLAFPLRWWALVHNGWIPLVVLAVYVGMCLYLHRGHWDRWLLLVPLYAAFSSLLLTPLGLIWYVRMALADRNAGLIRVRQRQRRHRGMHRRVSTAHC